MLKVSLKCFSKAFITSSSHPVATDNPSPSISSMEAPFIKSAAANSGSFLLHSSNSLIRVLSFILVVSQISPISRKILSIPTDISKSNLLKLVHRLFSSWMDSICLFFISSLFTFFFLFSVSFSFSNASFLSESEYCIRILDKFLERQSCKLYCIL